MPQPGPVAQEGVDLRRLTAGGEVALWAREIGELPRDERFGLESSWLENFRWSVRESEDGLVVDAEDTAAGRPYLNLRLVLSEKGARARAGFLTCVYTGPLTDLAGVATLLTDGEEAALEVELPCTSVSGRFITLRGRALLGGLATNLARKLLARRPEAPPERFHSFAADLIEFDGERLFASGYRDSLGRRQGVWTLFTQNLLTGTASTWQDGLPTGPAASWNEGRFVRLRLLFEGHADGPVYAWRPDGGLGSEANHSMGRPHGLMIQFHRNGRRSSARRFHRGLAIGDVEAWDESGALVERRPHRGIWSMLGEKRPWFWQDVEAARARCIAETAEFHTRHLSCRVQDSSSSESD